MSFCCASPTTFRGLILQWAGPDGWSVPMRWIADGLHVFNRRKTEERREASVRANAAASYAFVQRKGGHHERSRAEAPLALEDRKELAGVQPIQAFSAEPDATTGAYLAS